MIVIGTIKHVIEITGGIKLFAGIHEACLTCLLATLTAHALYSSNEHYIVLVDKLKETETMEQLHHAFHIILEWAEHNDVLVKIIA